MHEEKCKGGEAGGADRRGGRKDKGDYCPDCGGDDFRLLRSSVPGEAGWIGKGYTKVCNECGEVL